MCVVEAMVQWVESDCCWKCVSWFVGVVVSQWIDSSVSCGSCVKAAMNAHALLIYRLVDCHSRIHMQSVAQSSWIVKN